MKALRYLAILSILFFIFFVGCDLFPVSIENRVLKFQDELNSGRSLSDHFHPDMLSSYPQYYSDATFTGSPLGNQLSSYVINMTSAQSNHTVSIVYWDGLISSDGYTNRTIRFYFQQSGESWYILAIRIEWAGVGSPYDVGDYAGI